MKSDPRRLHLDFPIDPGLKTGSRKVWDSDLLTIEATRSLVNWGLRAEACESWGREMAGGHGEGITYKGLTLHQPKRWHTVTGKGLCAVMWLVFSSLYLSNPNRCFAFGSLSITLYCLIFAYGILASICSYSVLSISKLLCCCGFGCCCLSSESGCTYNRFVFRVLLIHRYLKL